MGYSAGEQRRRSEGSRSSSINASTRNQELRPCELLPDIRYEPRDRAREQCERHAEAGEEAPLLVMRLKQHVDLRVDRGDLRVERREALVVLLEMQFQQLLVVHHGCPTKPCWNGCPWPASIAASAMVSS